MKWLKMRSTWASGCHDWEYIPLYADKVDAEEIKELYVEPRVDNHSWSDKFRKIEWEIINTKQVPNTKIAKGCEYTELKIRGMERSIKDETEHLTEVMKLVGKGKKTDPDEVRERKWKKTMERMRKEKEKRIREENKKETCQSQ